jgi:hypothetical protein
MNIETNSPARQLPGWLSEQPGSRHEACDARSKAPRAAWDEDSWIDSVMQVCGAAWIIVCIVGRLCCR